MQKSVADGGRFEPEKESKLVRFELQPSELIFNQTDVVSPAIRS